MKMLIKQRIVLNSRLSPEIALSNIRKKSKSYKWSNRMDSELLCKIRGNQIYIYIPWGIEKREFKGSVQKNEDGCTLQGSFLVPIRTCCVHIGFWVCVWALLIFTLLNIPALILIKNKYFLIIFVGALLFSLFDIWYFGVFRSKKYEGKIISFLNNCLKEN